ncbi:MAG: hypothetical protein K0R68_3742 [Mycobacterium sp.]|jgi:MinD-like ATPase involved in chromosome partitioning or flagellar assembly|nr:hypothetical protein [Mycobacterium sp.]
MKKFGFATLAAAAVTAGTVALAAPAPAAPSGSTNAAATVASLEAQGYDVVVNRLSERSLADATVVSIGQGDNFTHAALQFGPVNTETVYVDVR